MDKQNKFFKMINLQNELNCKIDPNWIDLRRNWNRAIWLELSELLDHTPWKWWKNKHSEINYPQAQIEIVDVFHFILSKEIEEYKLNNISMSIEEVISDLSKTFTTIYDYAINSFDYDFNTDEYDNNLICENIEDVVIQILNDEPDYLENYFVLVKIFKMDLNILYKYYIGKHILNRFRQDYGYKEGKYIKTWYGLEDNEYLFGYLGETQSDDFEDEIYNKLKEKYEDVIKNCNE